MLRRLAILSLAAGLLTISTGCRSRCGQSHGWFSSNSRSAPCGTVAGCDPATGIPVSGPPGVGPAMVIPSSSRPDELPYPGPGMLIPPTGIPYAPPTVAPGDQGAGVLPPPKSGGVPVKNGK